MHPRVHDIFYKTMRKNIELALVSNGQLLDEGMCDMLGDASWVRISMDSATPLLYSFLRKTSIEAFSTVMMNIKKLVKYKRKSIVGIGFVVEKENYKEIYDAAKLFKDLGVDNFRISAAFTTMGYEYFSDFINYAKELSKKSEELSDDKFTVFNLFNDRIRDNFVGIQDYNFCPIKDLMTYIGADCNVYTCCTHAFNKKGFIGSIQNQRFKTLWKSNEKIDKFNSHNPSVICQHPCMYRDKNLFINYCIKKDPKHVNYI